MEELTPLARLARHGLEGQTHTDLGHAASFAWQRGIATGEMRYAVLWRLLTALQDSMDDGDWLFSSRTRAEVSDLVRMAFAETLEGDDPVHAASVGARWIETVLPRIQGR